MSDDGDLGLGRHLLPGAPVKPIEDDENNLIVSRSRSFPNNVDRICGCDCPDVKHQFTLKDDQGTVKLENGTGDWLFFPDKSGRPSISGCPEISRKHQLADTLFTSLPGHQESTLVKKVHERDVDIVSLRGEVEILKEQLRSKHRAIRIMQTQNMLAWETENKATKSFEKTTNSLERELCEVYWQLQCKDEALETSQRLWMSHLDRLASETIALKEAMKVQSEKLRRVTDLKAVMKRQRDELMSMIDVKDRMAYQPRMDEDDDGLADGEFVELIVLNACHCRHSLLEYQPCECAQTASKLKAENLRLRKQKEDADRRWEESSVMVDAYRMAFEEQISKSRIYLNSLLHCKNAVKFDRNEHSAGPAMSAASTGRVNINGHSAISSEQYLANSKTDEIAFILSEELADKQTAIANHRLAGKILANRVEELEQNLKHFSRTTVDKVIQTETETPDVVQSTPEIENVAHLLQIVPNVTPLPSCTEQKKCRRSSTIPAPKVVPHSCTPGSKLKRSTSNPVKPLTKSNRTGSPEKPTVRIPKVVRTAGQPALEHSTVIPPASNTPDKLVRVSESPSQAGVVRTTRPGVSSTSRLGVPNKTFKKKLIQIASTVKSP